MKYIQFDSKVLPNLEYSLFKEILQTNRSGAYLSTTIIGCNTRKYHGLLVCPIKQFGGESYVMLSSLQCSISTGDKPFNLGVQEYKGDYFEPKGHKYMIGYEASPSSTMTYRVGATVIKQQYILSENENQTMIRYTVVEAPEKFTMRLKPFLAFRNVHQLTHENMEADTHYNEVDGGISFRLYKDFPDLYIQASKSMDFVAMPDWYRDIEYIQERYRGYGFREDLYVPGFFETEMQEGDTVVVSASLTPANPKQLKAKFTREEKSRQPKDSLKDVLINAAQQFTEREPDGSLMLKAGFHWKRPQLRDTFLALPGLMIFQQDKRVFDEILRTCLPNLRRLYIDEASVNNTSIDIPLWFFHCLNEMERFRTDNFDTAEYYDTMKSLLDHYWVGVPGKMHRQSDGLIYARNEGHPQQWMNAQTSYGHMVTPRYGCAVEVNALWYNAIATTIEVAERLGDKAFADEWRPRLEQIGKAFQATFVKPDGTLFDRTDGEYRSPKIRANQVIAAGLKFSPLTREQKKAVVDLATAKLLTPYGLRTLSPESEDYHGAVEGDEDERAFCAHQGTAYPWLLSFYADALMAVHKNSCMAQLRRLADGFEAVVKDHGIGSISESYNGNPPYKSEGCISMASSVAAVLKLLKLIEPK